MKKIWLILIPILLSASACLALTFNHAYDIENVYISAKGNNIHEARIKAREQGVLRAFFLMMDKIELMNEGLNNLTYEDISQAIQHAQYEDEKTTNTSYSARVNYSFDYEKLDDIIFKYSNEKVMNRINQCMVIPVMKRGNNILLVDDEDVWLRMWKDQSELLASHKVILPELDNFRTKKILRPDNILKITFDELKSLMQKYLTRKAIIIVAEFFTNWSDGVSEMKLQYRTIHLRNIRITAARYPLPAEIELIIKDVIDDFIDAEGVPPVIKEIYGEDTEEMTIPQVLGAKISELNNPRNITMIAKINNQHDWETLKAKLVDMEQVQAVKIIKQQGKKVKFMLTYKSTKGKFAKELFSKGLSYVKRNEQYILIKVNKGI